MVYSTSFIKIKKLVAKEVEILSSLYRIDEIGGRADSDQILPVIHERL
jgi:hypothetical protein